jgi:hypothetical protein
LKLQYDEQLSNVAFSFNLRRYILCIEQGVFEVKSTAGDTHLGRPVQVATC